MSELDDLYVRTRRRWEQDPEKFERDEPLLARALSEQQTDLGPVLALRARQIGTLEQRVRDLERELEDRMAHAAERERALRRDLVAEQQHSALLAGELAEKAQEMAQMPSETDTLAALGWKKG